LRFNMDKGLEVALPWGSLGRSVLAFLPPSEVEMVLRSERAGPLTGIARPARGELETELNQIKLRGYARYCEPQIDLAGLAAPVFNGNQEVLGSLGLIMPSSRFRAEAEDELAAMIKAAANDLSQQAAISHS
jgi:IclR family acetate operon transcriptional repressor